MLELVDGETLAARIQRGPLPFDEAIAIAREIAEALEAAHERGIVHRDLKPANIALTSSDRVKVLDFGLAKAADAAGADSVPPLNAPTITSPAMLTQAGMILGTAAYMSPEQTRGRPADKRSDVWAFGCVLFEMLTGRRAFDGDDVSDTLASVLRSDPAWNAVPSSVPPQIRTLLKGCLEKNHHQRISDISTALFVLKHDHSPQVDPPKPEPSSALRRAVILAVAVAASVATGAAAAVLFWARTPARDTQVARFTLPITDGRILTLSRRAVTVSPDGSQIAYAADGRIYLRPVAEAEARPVAGADPGILPAFSPDGRSLVFWADGALKRISIAGGVPVTICPVTPAPFHIDWDDSGILFTQFGKGLMRVSADGGAQAAIVRLTDKDGTALQSVQLLPDGDTVLFSLARADAWYSNVWQKADVFIQSIRTGERKTVVEGGSDARYVPTGHLIYIVDGTLMAAPFDLDRKQVTAGQMPVIEGVRRVGGAHFAVSDTGVLVYIPGPARAGEDQVFLYDRNGVVTPLPLPRGSYQNPRASRDGKWLALETHDGKQTAISVYELAGESSIRRLTFGGNNRVPVWSADGKRLAFQSDRDGDRAIFWQPAEGGPAERLTRPEPGTFHTPESWSKSADVMLFSVTKDAETTLWTFSLRDRKTSRFGDVTSIGVPTNAIFSPDGHWVAYQSGDATTAEPMTYVQPFPATGTKFEIARAGRPLWSPEGDELFLVPAPSQFIAVSVRTQPTFGFKPPVKVLRRFGLAPPGNPRPYDILPDGRFVAVDAAGGEQAAPQIQVVLNWFEELRGKQPGRK